MSSSIEHDPDGDLAHSRRLRLAIVMAPAAWGVQELASWLTSEFVCANADSAAGAALRVAQILISVAALIVAGAAFVLGARGWQATHPADYQPLAATRRDEFVAIVALLVAAASVLGILWAAIGPIVLPLCERGR